MQVKKYHISMSNSNDACYRYTYHNVSGMSMYNSYYFWSTQMLLTEKGCTEIGLQ